MMENQPNLFNYATSELSQDAFICWLAAWADPKWTNADPNLHRTGLDFIISMIRKVKPDYDSSSLRSIKVQPQVNKLDILIEVNKDADDRLAILIEDKTHTNNHSDQLNRYYKQVVEAGYSVSQMIPIYFKTGYQSRFDEMGEFKTYLRSDFLDVLRKGKTDGMNNDIYNDFLRHLEGIDSIIRQFSSKDPTKMKWEYGDWIGFFMSVYDSRKELYMPFDNDGANWNYVANPSGGFYGFWWYFKELPGKSFTPYLQLEQDLLCFKIIVENESDRRSARDEAHQKLLQTIHQHEATLQRPERMGNGKFMTVARWDKDYRVFNNGQLDMEATLKNLKKAQDILDLAFPQ